MLKIGEFSRLAQVSVKTLRYYDEMGLLLPAWVDRFTSYRYYTLDQLARLNRILVLRDLGFSLVQIAQLLQEDLPVGDLQRLMRLRHAELAHQVQEDQARLARVAGRLRQIELEGAQPRYEVLVKRAPRYLVAGIRETVGDRVEATSLFQELRRYLERQGVAAGNASPWFALHYNTEYADGEADIEAAVALERPMRGSNRVAVHELPEVTALSSIVHQLGEEIQKAYGAMLVWTHANRYRAGGPVREIYLQGFTPGVDPRAGVMEIQLPLESTTYHSTDEMKEKHEMEPRIVTKPEFTVVGLPFVGHVSHAPYEGSKSNNEIGDLWDRLSARTAEIKNINGPAVGLCFGMPNDTSPWYIAGREVERPEDVPADMMSITVPTRQYAVYSCTLSTLGETYRYITEESGLEHADAPDFEYYGEEFDPSEPGKMPLSIYWPIG